MYIDVAPAIPLTSNKELFTYESDADIQPGAIVSIPFGPRVVRGVVIKKVGRKPPYRTKKISKVYAASLTDDQIAIGARMSGTLLGGLGFTLRLFFPPSLTITTPAYKGRLSRSPVSEDIVIAPTAKRIEILRKQAQGHQVLILVPERWMTDRFNWAIPYHAGLKSSEVRPIWEKIAAGEDITIVGTQKALYLPWRRLYCIVLDEEYLPTHKLWDGYPRGDNRHLMTIASDIYHASTITSGSFPSLAAYHKLSTQKKVSALTSVKTPNTHLIPFSFEDRQFKRLLPNDLVTRLRSWKHTNKSVCIIHNELDGRVAKALSKLRLLKKDQIVIGTSALFAKLDDTQFDHTVWMFPERAFASPDFRSSERGYALIVRLATMQKKFTESVVLVTKQADFVERNIQGTYSDVYTRILAERKKYMYPPFSDMVKLTYLGRTEKDAHKRAVQARLQIERKLVDTRDTIRALGPYGIEAKKQPKKKVEKHLLVLGDLEALVSAYRPTLPDIVDVNPERVL